MIKLGDFIPLVRAAIPRFREEPPDDQQVRCMLSPSDAPLMIIAGPGSGKTTVLVLRALRFVFVDGIMPEEVVLTTFTRKAASELRSRLIEWGHLLGEHLRRHPPRTGVRRFKEWIDSVDTHRFVTALDVSRRVIDRLIQDRVNMTSFAADQSDRAGRRRVQSALDAYRTYMAETNRMDFAGLEDVFLRRLAGGRLSRFTNSVRALLGDEYQDTNPLQEAIYFELVRQSEASLTVVGDDDQALYRFRGATVELFCNLADRLRRQLPNLPEARPEHLIDNYRSTPEAIKFFNDFITTDPEFASARAKPPKPDIVASLPSNGLPVLGMFRSDTPTLAADIAGFLHSVFRGGGSRISLGGREYSLAGNSNGGDIGDAVFLAHTVNEYAAAWGNNPPRQRLPLLLRDELAQRGISVFNPRGRALRDIPEVQRLLGTMLECIDPGAAHQNAVHITAEARRYLNQWRQESHAFLGTDPPPTRPQGLSGFVAAWQSRTSQTDQPWPSEWPILELCYKLVTWLPRFHDDPEGQVYLEAVSRCIAQATAFSPYRSAILHGQGPYDDRSARAAIVDVMTPLAENAVDVDEEIMPHVPRERLPLMTIHQVKGLEFPLVIVDVGSDYRTNHRAQAFRRFPDAPSAVHLLEDDLAPHCDIGPLRQARPPLSRAFDDLVRLYYVAFSRAQSLLMLVGLTPGLRYGTAIRNVAMGWRRDGSWRWREPTSGRPPSRANNIPMELI